MNMKKTLAAVSAATVAVSAMATTVSASEGVSFTYNLVSQYKIKTQTAALKVEINNKYLTDGSTTPVIISLRTPGIDLNNKTISLTGYNADTGRPIDYKFTSDKGAADWTGWAEWDKDKQVYTLTIPAGSSVHAAFLDSTGTGAALCKITASLDAGSTTTYASQTALNEAIEKITDEKDSTEFDADSGYALKAVDTVNVNNAAIDAFIGVDITDTTDVKWVNNRIDSITGDVGDGSGTYVYRATVMGTYKGDSYTAKKPFHTSLNGTSATGEVISYLDSEGFGLRGEKEVNKVDNKLYPTGDDWNNYVNVRAVLNDVIRTNEDVIFEFKTATDDVITDGEWTGFYATGIPNPGTKDSQYKKFAQHTFNLFGDEKTDYIYTTDAGFWTGNNLFQGALIVNNTYSMQLSDIQAFDYGKDTVSFSWNEVTGGANVNEYAKMLTTMQLATSTDWYWDSLTVKGVAAASADEVGSGEGATADDGTMGDELDEESGDEVVDDGGDEVVDGGDDVVDAGDDVVDAGDDAVDAADVPADTQDEKNPGTGNAPIALAVIPVALAAAAVVAKKRG